MLCARPRDDVTFTRPSRVSPASGEAVAMSAALAAAPANPAAAVSGPLPDLVIDLTGDYPSPPPPPSSTVVRKAFVSTTQAVLPPLQLPFTQPPLIQPTPQQQLPQSISSSRPRASSSCDEEPPAKRRRDENYDASNVVFDSTSDGVGDGVRARRRSIKSCVREQILPHVDEVVRRLPRDLYKTDDMAIRTVAVLARSPLLRLVLDDADECTYQTQTAEAASAIISRLKLRSRYQIRPFTFSDRQVVCYSLRPPPRHALPDASRHGFCSVPRPYAPRPLLAPQPALEKAKGPDRLEQQLKLRPYMPATQRDLVSLGVRKPIRPPAGLLEWPFVYHVDMTRYEMVQMLACIAGGPVFTPDGVLALPLACLFDKTLSEAAKTLEAITESSITNEFCVLYLLGKACLRYNVPMIVRDSVPSRGFEDICNFCNDLIANRITQPGREQILSIDKESNKEKTYGGRTPSLLFARELTGNAGFGRSRRLDNFQSEFAKAHEDALTLVAEYTNCAGDISALSWVPDGNVLCGTTTHSDALHQQYNKAGNLLLCSVLRGRMRAFADHRVPRPRVAQGENSSEAMRQSQDSWLYSSVVSSDYDAVHGRAFTSSFDRTVKVWSIARHGGDMRCVATWRHDGNVNFVAAARDASGLVASAADVPSHAVRVYRVRDGDIAHSPYQAISCTRTDAVGCPKWAYFPATMQWGRASGTQRLLLVGYSPRSRSGDDRDIPEDRRDSGELVLWDADRSCRVPVMTATAANVFEVAWHPTLRRFVAATSPTGISSDSKRVRTQIRIFQWDYDRSDNVYSEIQKLDCPAADINELAIMPNSLRHAYIVAGCTDRKAYVWDTARGDDPMHVLRHGESIDDFYHDREKEDTGVKFVAWGSTANRLYTGSSDGSVKVWNVRNARRPFVRNLLDAPGPISIGAFSPDRSRLAIGDATGRLFILSTDRRDECPGHSIRLPDGRQKRMPTPFIPHAEPPPPQLNGGGGFLEGGVDESKAAYARRTFLDSGRLVLHRNRTVGAVQGPAYAATGLFRREAHWDENPGMPLRTEFQRVQRQSVHASCGRRRAVRRLKDVWGGPNGAAAIGDDQLNSHIVDNDHNNDHNDNTSSDLDTTTITANSSPKAHQARQKQHEANRSLDIDSLRWRFPDLWNDLRRDGAVLPCGGAEDDDLGWEDWGFEYEEGPDWDD